ncbi:MAG TPA: hypothetical protein VK625_13290, partial [Flavitalea sp.]|nr:hypothetical protein [Flavitalea sp.]
RYNEIYIYERLKQYAIHNKEISYTHMGDPAILLNRFRPLIMNEISGKSVKSYVMVKEIHPNAEYRNFYIKMSNGDSLLIDVLIGKERETADQ